jgi:NhaP-type Na+/H+ and K+/H+ antiporter
MIYARLLALGVELGIPRRPSQTPSEYLHDLKMTFVNQEAELEQITAAYINLRYGESPELSEQVQLVTLAWEVVAREGKRLGLIRKALADKEKKQTSPPV